MLLVNMIKWYNKGHFWFVLHLGGDRVYLGKYSVVKEPKQFTWAPGGIKWKGQFTYLSLMEFHTHINWTSNFRFKGVFGWYFSFLLKFQ